MEIDNVNDFSVQELKESLGYGSATPIFIKFKILVDKYEEYNLKYEDVSLDDYIYEGEITNKKHKISDNYYMCYYEKTIYDNTDKDRFKKFKIDRMFLKLSSVILIFLIMIYAINIISKKVFYKRIN